MKLLLVITSFLFSISSFADVTYTPVFNEPGFGSQSTLTIEYKLISLINRAESGSSIRVAEYVLAREPVAKALVLASERGVDVELVLDGSQDIYAPGSPVDILLNGFENHRGIDLCEQKPCVKFCRGPLSALDLNHGELGGGCHGLVINHNKFFLFSNLGSQSNIVVQTSANIDQFQLRKYNDLLEIDDDQELYQGYMQYWIGF